jgi:hypothetical protein
MQSAKKEWESTNKAKFTDLEWERKFEVLSQNHVYHTDYAIKIGSF